MKPAVKRSGLEAMRAQRQQKENALAPEVQRWKGEARDAQMRADSERRQRQMFEGVVSSKVGQEVLKVIEDAMAREVRRHIYEQIRAAISKVGDTKGYAVQISVPVEMIVFAKMQDGHPVEPIYRRILEEYVAGARQDGRRLSVSSYEEAVTARTVVSIDIPALRTRHEIDPLAMRYR